MDGFNGIECDIRRNGPFFISNSHFSLSISFSLSFNLRSSLLFIHILQFYSVVKRIHIANTSSTQAYFLSIKSKSHSISIVLHACIMLFGWTKSPSGCSSKKKLEQQKEMGKKCLTKAQLFESNGEHFKSI